MLRAVAAVLCLLPAAAGCVRHEPRLPREPDEPVLAAGAAAGASDADPFFRSFLGREPPPLPRRGTWVNAARPTPLDALRGRVVLLDFSFLRCGACAFLTPRLVEWHARYAERGLSIVYVDNGRSDALDALQAWHVDHGLPFSLFHDRLGRAVLDYGVRAFPTVYLIGRDGRVAWEGVATGLEASLEDAIVRALAAGPTR